MLCPRYRCTCQQVYLSTGVPVNRCTCQQVYLSTGVHVNRCTCQQVYLSTGVPVNRCTCQQVYLSTGVPVNRCTCQQVYLSTGVPVNRCTCQQVYLSTWRGHAVVVNVLRDALYRRDFQHGLASLAQLQPRSHVTQLIGYCGDTYVAAYHRLGSPLHLTAVLSQPSLASHDTVATRLRVCRSYVDVLRRLHNDRLVMCDSNDVHKTLSQYLLTDDLEVVANDLDALPRVTSAAGVVCGNRELGGQFVAPEQRWPYPRRKYFHREMPPYDEKSDIWKIPDVCELLIGEVSGGELVRFHLFSVHKRCKETDPALRPSAAQVLAEYDRVTALLTLSSPLTDT